MKNSIYILLLTLFAIPVLGQKKETNILRYERDTLQHFKNKALIRTKTFSNEQLIEDLTAYHIPDSIVEPYYYKLPISKSRIRVPSTYSITYIESLIREGPYFKLSIEGNSMKAIYKNGNLVEATYFNSNNERISFDEFYRLGPRALHIGQGKPQYDLDKKPEVFLVNYYKGKPSKPKRYKKPKPQKIPKH